MSSDLEQPGDAGVPRVLLCDDAVGFPTLFRRWMVDCGVDLIGQVETAEEAVSFASREAPDVIVVDHLLRDATSDGLAPRLREVAPGAKLLLISGMPEPALAVAAKAAGADAHISKAASARAMCDAILALAR